MNTLQNIYKVLIGWTIISLIIFAIAGVWTNILYVFLYVFVFGSIIYRYRRLLGDFLRKMRLDTTFGFAMLVIVTVLIEEFAVYFIAGPAGIMHPNLVVNMILISIFWLTWLFTWKWYIAKKYYFTHTEAILTAGFAGLMYEIIGTLKFLDPTVLFLMTPISILIYAVVAILPIQMITFTGTKDTKSKYIVSTIVPFVATWPFALVAYFTFTLMGVSL